MNVFDIRSPDPREHFICCSIISYLLSDLTQKDRDEFVTTKAVIEEMQSLSFLPSQTEHALRRLTNKRLSKAYRGQFGSLFV